MTLEQAIARLRELNEPVPKPFRQPTSSEVAQMEKELGVSFHPDYVRFLLGASDVAVGVLEPGTITNPESHTHLTTVVSSARKYGVPTSLFPFCADNADFYCLSSSGEVICWSHNGSSTDTWPNLASWIEQVWIAGA